MLQAKNYPTIIEFNPGAKCALSNGVVMVIDFSVEPKDFSGEPLKLKDDGPNLTLKDIITLAIKTPLQDDPQLSLDKKLDLDKIGELVWSGAGELETDQATLIKERISKVFPGPAIAGAVRRAIG